MADRPSSKKLFEWQLAGLQDLACLPVNGGLLREILHRVPWPDTAVVDEFGYRRLHRLQQRPDPVAIAVRERIDPLVSVACHWPSPSKFVGGLSYPDEPSTAIASSFAITHNHP